MIVETWSLVSYAGKEIDAKWFVVQLKELS